VLSAKKDLVLALIYYNFILTYQPFGFSFVAYNSKVLQFKKDSTKPVILQALKSSKIFHQRKLFKLCLRAKIIAVSIYWE
jgi:hypothetical protein